MPEFFRRSALKAILLAPIAFFKSWASPFGPVASVPDEVAALRHQVERYTLHFNRAFFALAEANAMHSATGTIQNTFFDLLLQSDVPIPKIDHDWSPQLEAHRQLHDTSTGVYLAHRQVREALYSGLHNDEIIARMRHILG